MTPKTLKNYLEKSGGSYIHEDNVSVDYDGETPANINYHVNLLRKDGA